MRKSLFWMALALGMWAQATGLRAQTSGNANDVNSIYGNSRADSIAWKNSICLMPLSFLGAGLELAGEHYFAEQHTSTRVNVGYFLATNPWFYSNYKDYSGFRIEVQQRFYILRNTYQSFGLYFAPYAQFKMMNLANNSNSYNGGSYPYNFKVPTVNTSALGFGFLLGFQQRHVSRILVDAYLGGGFIVPTQSTDQDINIGLVNNYSKGIAIHGGFGFGIFSKVKK